MTGGADKLVKFWDFSVEKGTLGMSLARQLQMTHDVSVRAIQPRLEGEKTEEKVLVAIGLMDHTIKVFYEDSLKFFLSLYGHKLPVMCLDISYDSNLLVSGSADKTIKIWGLDFGDCHRSLIAHEDSVTSIRFQPKTHYFSLVGKTEWSSTGMRTGSSRSSTSPATPPRSGRWTSPPTPPAA